jgi:hypothetical protein
VLSLGATRYYAVGPRRVAPSGGAPADVTDYVARWNLNEGSGTNITDSASGNNGVFVGNVSWIAGHNGGYALQSKGTAGYVQLINSNLTNVGAGDFSVTWWTTDAPTGSTSQAYSGLVVFNGAGVVMTRTSATGSATNWCVMVGSDAKGGFMSPPTNVWTHCALTRTGTTYTGYTNGVVAAITAYTDAGYGLANAYYLGRGYSYATYWQQGGYDDVRIYGRVLSAAEVSNIYQATK